MHIAAEGARIVLAIAALGLILIALRFESLGLAVLVGAIVIALFFRDPDRFPSRSEAVVISGADGKVVDIAEATLPQLPERPFRRVSVFMSPLNVHVNRAPVGGQVGRITHTAGNFRAAFNDHASEHNERTMLMFKDDAGRMHPMVQVAGYLARRIVCWLRPHDKVQIGQRIGLIMFGSRVDHFIPADFHLTVSIGDRVRAGESVLAELRQ